MNESGTSTPCAAEDGLALAAPALAAVLHDLPRACGLDAAMAIADTARRRLIGPGLLTVNLRSSPLPADGVSDGAGDATLVLQRIWTSNPGAYPVAGRKRKALTPWTRQLFLRGEVFVGEGSEVLASVFDDHALIASLDLLAVINVPVFDGNGQCFASFNLLGTQPRWAPEAVSIARVLAALCTPAIAQGARALQP